MGGESNREEPWVSSVELTLRKAGNYHKVGREGGEGGGREGGGIEQ